MTGSALEGDAGDVHGSQVQLVAGHLTQHVRRVKSVCAGAFKRRRDSVGGLVQHLVDLEDLLYPSGGLPRIPVGLPEEHDWTS